MAKAIAFLKKGNGGRYRTDRDGLSPVYIRYGHNSKTVLFPTNVKIKPIYWNGDPDQPIRRGMDGYTTANKTILGVKSIINKISGELTEKEIEPTVEAVRNKYEQRKEDKNPRPETFFDLYEEFIRISESQKSQGTIIAYKACLMRLKESASKKRDNPSLDQVDLKFCDDFINYLFKIDLFNNTVGKHIKNLKVFLHYLEKRGYELNVNTKDLKILKEKVPIIFLTQEEFNQFYDYDFSKNKRLERVRDIFVLGCSTGLRISDLKRLGREHIQSNIIKMTAFKTKRSIFVPLIPRSFEILSKYSFKLPEISDQKYNSYLKEVCRIAGIDHPVEKITYKGGKKIITKVPKWELISSHVAVKTFITHCGQNGISPKVVAEITGKTVKIILDHYYGTDESTIIREMARGFGGLSVSR